MGIIIIPLCVTIVGGIILFFLSDFFNKPRDKFTAWIQQKSRRKKKRKKANTIDPNKDQKLKQLAQQKFKRGREEIDRELNKAIRDNMEKYSMDGMLYSGPFLRKAVELHSYRILRLCEQKKAIDIEVFLNSEPMKSNEEIEFIMKDLEEIAWAQTLQFMDAKIYLFA